MITRQTILEKLPAFKDEWIVVHHDQHVRHIISEVLNAHKLFASDYDLFAADFDGDTIEEIASNLFDFCKRNIEYKEEGDEWQTTALPAGILSRGYGDCKHYASFCGGVLDALNRRGKSINWCYRFASYRMLDSTPHHVFVVIKKGDREIWIDPTPEAAGKVPVWQIDKKVKGTGMALIRNVAGIGDAENDLIVVAPDVNAITQTDLEAALEEVDTSVDISEADFEAIQLLIFYQVLNEDGSVLNARLDQLSETLPEPERDALREAYLRYTEYQAQKIAGFFADAWRGIKTVSLAIPRNAFLGLVALNVFGFASKMSRLLAIPEARKKLIDKWYSLGGKESGIVSAINSGAKKKAILAGVNSVGAAPAAAAAPAWLAVAGAIIAAIIPLVNSLLKSNNQYTPDFAAYDQNYLPGAAGGGFLDTIKNFVAQNPALAAAAAAGLIYIVWKD